MKGYILATQKLGYWDCGILNVQHPFFGKIFINVQSNEYEIL